MNFCVAPREINKRPPPFILNPRVFHVYVYGLTETRRKAWVTPLIQKGLYRDPRGSEGRPPGKGGEANGREGNSIIPYLDVQFSKVSISSIARCCSLKFQNCLKLKRDL